MKSIKLLVFLGLFLSSGQIFGGNPYIIEYSPSNPVAGQQVTFTIINYQICEIESLIPDAANNIGNLIAFSDSDPSIVIYTYPSPGAYHVALDLEFNDECDGLRETNNKRSLTSDFQMGPVGGPYSSAVMQGEIFCSPLTVAAAPAPIPTMGQWGLIILGLTSAIIGAVYLISNSRLSTKRNL